LPPGCWLPVTNAISRISRRRNGIAKRSWGGWRLRYQLLQFHCLNGVH
jgi:hypothetical protein